MEGRRVTRGRGKPVKKNEDSETSEEFILGEEEDARKSRIRDTNKEFAKRMAILQTWSDYWIDYTTREGEAYSKLEAKNLIKRTKKISCPIESCRKTFTTIGGLKYHYARCNIERCFKCKVCTPYEELKTRGDLLRHMIRAHYDRLPPLKDEQEEIALAFLNTDSRSERAKFRRSIFGDTEHSFALPRFYIKSYADLVINTFAPESVEQRPFKDWFSSIKDWDLLNSDADRRRFYPPELTSVRFKTSRSATYTTLDIGESTVLRGENDRFNSIVFYTGGINTAAAWLPKPSHIKHETNNETVAIAVSSSSMDKSISYKEMKDITGCVQFWTTTLSSNNSINGPVQRPTLELMIGHNFGFISAMCWCPLGASYDSSTKTAPYGTLPRLGLLALACGDAQIRIISVPDLDRLKTAKPSTIKRIDELRNVAPMFRVKPVATLMPPGIGISTDCQPIACTSLAWNVEDNQRLIVAGYSNGDVALFDLANSSPILYSTMDNRHTYQSYKKWQAHLLPVLGVGIFSSDVDRTLIASGGRDRLLRLWDSGDMESSLSFERAPITNLVWDYRLRGIVTASEAAFTSFVNRVGYRYPSIEGFTSITVSIHRATVCGLNNSLVTSALATSDEAGEVLLQPTGRPNQKRSRNIMDTRSLYTLVPRSSEGIEHSDKMNETMCSDTDAIANSSANNEMIDQADENNDPNNEDMDEANAEYQATDDYTFAERPIANKPAKILLPLDEDAVETYLDFKNKFVLEFIEYDDKISRASNKLPEAWTRASNAANIYCDRVCDYPFSSIKHVTWSPNIDSYSYLLSSTHIGFCRFDRVTVLETIYRGHIDTMFAARTKEKNSK
uniref:General transcription factor 3C polypeptide 2 n=1 Tax=Aceria tosichella TaxID=561515 RepID=A0A6G1SJ35_9ACAR